MSNVFPEKAISAVTKVITSPVDKKTMPDEIPVFLCNYTDVYYNSKITGNMPFMEATAKQSEIDRFSLFPNDVVITKDSERADDIGIPTYIQSIRENLLCGYHLTILRPKKNVDGRFLSLTLMHPRISYDFYRYANGITRFGLTTETYSKVKIPLPPLPEQKAIAALLSTWDKAIEKTERLIQAKERRFRWLLCKLMTPATASSDECSVMSDEWRNNSDFSTHNPASAKDAPPRKTQKNTEWKKVKIGSFLTESRIPGSNGRDAKKITVKLYGKGVIAKDERRIGSQTTQYCVRKSGQFVYSKLDFLNGAFGIIPEELDGFESTLDLPAFDVVDSVSKEWFLFYLIRPEYYKRQLGLAKGQRKARRVNPSEFLKSKIPCPPLEVQKQIAETLSAAQREIDLLKEIAEKYKTQKRGLMQKMLTGEWRVRGFATNDEG